jgi:hypothetical protein
MTKRAGPQSLFMLARRRRPAATTLLLMGLVCPSTVVADQAPVAGQLRVIVIDGDEAANIVAERIAAEPVVEVRERDDRKVPGAVVRFFIRRTVRNRIAALFSDGRSEVTALTDEAGRAQAAAISPVEPGSYQIDVQVSHQGRTATATIRQTNYATRADAQNAGPPAPASGAGATATGVAAAAGGGLSKLAVLGIVAGGAAGGGAAAILARRESGASGPRLGAIAVQTPLGMSGSTGLQGGTAFTFSIEATDFDPGSLTYLWEFGDGATSTEAAPAHIYNVAGSYTAAVTVSDAQQSLRSDIQVNVIGLTGTWVMPGGGVYTLRLVHTGSSFTGSADVGPASDCPLSGALELSPGEPHVIALFQPVCIRSAGFPPVAIPYGALSYRLRLLLPSETLSGTVGLPGGGAPISFVRQ